MIDYKFLDMNMVIETTNNPITRRFHSKIY